MKEREDGSGIPERPAGPFRYAAHGCRTNIGQIFNDVFLIGAIP